MKCLQCPKHCNIDRTARKGFCGESDKLRVAKIIENFKWEEPCISGNKGALAIFFSGCNLRCNFCQNYEISHKGKGKEYTPQGFRELLESYDMSKYDSLDLVTPTQFSLQLVDTFHGYNKTLPIVFNSNGYESEETIRKVAEFADVFLVDLKFYDKELSTRLAGAPNYFEVASKAVKLMSKLKPNRFKNGILTQGVLIRHLILPGQVRDSIRLLDYIKAEIETPFVSIMSQFTPIGKGELKRKITPLEFKTVLAHAEKLGLDNGYFQDLDSANECFIPKF
ncbi:MAG: radical SAM protein [Acetobacter sp.]|nr:radical SAM protein [Acetobacter sp.]